MPPQWSQEEPKLSLGQKLKVPGKEAGNSHDRGKAVASKGAASKHVVAKTDPKKPSSKPADKNSKVATSHKSKQSQPRPRVRWQTTDVAKGKHSPVTTARSGAGKQQAIAKGKGAQTASSKNAKTDKKLVANTDPPTRRRTNPRTRLSRRRPKLRRSIPKRTSSPPKKMRAS